MGGAIDLSSIFGGGANAAGLGGLLSSLQSGLGQGLGGGQTIGGNQATNNAIADALGWTYGYGDQTGSITAQQALDTGGDGGPTAMSTAQQYMQNQQQNQQAQTDTGQPPVQTPAQQAMAQQPPVSLAQAYGPQGPWEPGGSTSPAAAAQGPQGFPQVAGPATTAAAPPLGTQTPAGGYTAPERSAVTSYGSPVTPGATSSVASPDQWQAAKQQMRSMVGAPPPGQVPMPQPRPAEADYNEIDAAAGQGNIPLPQPRPAAADAAPAPPRAAAPPAAARPPAPVAATPPAANDPAARAIPAAPGAPQGAPQNPIQAIMQALGLQNLPPQMQQAAQQIIRQVLAQLMPQLQGMMGGQPGGQQFGGGQGLAIDPRTGQPPINPRTGQPYPPGTSWDQIPWAQGWDPSKQQQGVPGRGWENYSVPNQRLAPGFSHDARGNITRNGRPPDYWSEGQPLWVEPPGADRADRPRGYNPAPTGSPYAPDPNKPDYNDPREWKYNPKTKDWGPHHVKHPPPGIDLPPEKKTAENLPTRGMKDRMTPEEIRRQELDFEKGGMTPQQMRKLRERIKELNDSRRLIGEVGGSKTGKRDAPASELLKQRIETGPNQPVIGYPPPNTGGAIWGYNQPYFDPATGQMVRPDNDPNRDMGTTYMNQYFRGM